MLCPACCCLAPIIRDRESDVKVLFSGLDNIFTSEYTHLCKRFLNFTLQPGSLKVPAGSARWDGPGARRFTDFDRL
jgi:hypothetical protein